MNGFTSLCGMKLNSLVTPSTGIGTTPLYWRNQLDSFNQNPQDIVKWQAFWNSYCVLGSKITMHLSNLDTDNAVTICVFPDESGTVAQTGDMQPPFISMPYARYVMLGPRDSGRSTAKLTNYMTIAKLKGIPKRTPTINDGFSAQFAPTMIDPRYIDFWMTCGQRNDSAATGLEVAVQGSLIFYTKLFLRKDPNQT